MLAINQQQMAANVSYRTSGSVPWGFAPIGVSHSQHFTNTHGGRNGMSSSSSSYHQRQQQQIQQQQQGQSLQQQHRQQQQQHLSTFHGTQPNPLAAATANVGGAYYNVNVAAAASNPYPVRYYASPLNLPPPYAAVTYTVRPMNVREATIPSPSSTNCSSSSSRGGETSSGTHQSIATMSVQSFNSAGGANNHGAVNNGANGVAVSGGLVVVSSSNAATSNINGNGGTTMVSLTNGGGTSPGLVSAAVAVPTTPAPTVVVTAAAAAAAPPLQVHHMQPIERNAVVVNSAGAVVATNGYVPRDNGVVGFGSAGGNSHGRENADLSRTNLYIRGLCQSTTDRDLITMCSPYGKITSTKAIMDKATNQCRGYGFVDFESDASAKTAIKGLLDRGIQAQLAKHQKHDHPTYTPQPPLGHHSHNHIGSHQSHRHSDNHIQVINHHSRDSILSPTPDQDPTNLYFANLPLGFREYDLEHMLLKYGHVVSTRILRDEANVSKGVGFARMETKEKCEKVIRSLNGIYIHGCKDPILVKFADSGPKRRAYKGDIRLWRNAQGSPIACEPTTMITNGIPASTMVPALAHYTRYGPAQPITGYSVPAQWVPQYIVHQPTSHIPSVEVVPPTDHSCVGYNSLMSQLATHVSTLQIGANGPYVAAAATSPHPPPYYFAPAATTAGFIQTIPYAANIEDHPPAIASPEDCHHYQTKWWYSEPPSYNLYSGPLLDYHQ